MKQVVKEILKSVLPRTVIRAVKKKPTIISEDEIKTALEHPESKGYESLILSVNKRKSPYDEMIGQDAQYLKVGLSALKIIQNAIDQLRPKKIETILDLPCGHGRVMRYLRAHFKDAEITACDTNKDGVGFCAKEFGAVPFYSKHQLETFNIGKKFDLIWCGSLATHFDEKNTTELLKFFERHLNQNGLLVFSMHGEFVLSLLRSRKDIYTLDEAGVKKVITETETTGYGYADYPLDNGYGISVATPQWVEQKLNEVGKWKKYQFEETAWVHHHDVYAVVKA